MPEPGSRESSVGRSTAIALFGLLVGAVTAVWSVQIIRQGFWPEVVQADVACRPGILELIQALERARQSAAEQELEQSAVDAFRQKLRPSWQRHPHLTRICADDASARKLLVKLERLRFAEEHAVRYSARDVAFWRREIARTAAEWSAPSPAQ